MSKAKSVGKFVVKEQVTVPDGVYQGIWGGYEVEMAIDGRTVEFRTNNGVRGFNIPVTVTVKNGAAEITSRP